MSCDTYLPDLGAAIAEPRRPGPVPAGTRANLERRAGWNTVDRLRPDTADRDHSNTLHHKGIHRIGGTSIRQRARTTGLASGKHVSTMVSSELHTLTTALADRADRRTGIDAP